MKDDKDEAFFRFVISLIIIGIALFILIAGAGHP